MIDQLKIDDKSSFDDFGASLAKRNIKMPKKKSIKETLPFSNIAYDFSNINGEVYYEEREIEYIFEITASDPERLEELKAEFANWIMNTTNEKIYDPFIPYHHFEGTYESIEFEDEIDIEKTTVTVSFLVYPYKISNSLYMGEFEIPANTEKIVTIINNSSHKIIPTITTTNDITILVDNTTLSADNLVLNIGLNDITINNSNDEVVTVSISFYEEVF